MRQLPLLVFLLLSLALAAMLLQKNITHNPGSQSREVMPAISVTSPDGQKHWDATALKGHVTLINFFASWCAPCAAEMPELTALKKQFPSLRMEGIAWNDNPATLKKWLGRNGNPFHRLWLDKNGGATIALGIKGIPESFLVDNAGIIRYRLTGPLTAQLRDSEFAAFIQQLLHESAHEK